MKKRNLFKLAALTAVFALGSMFANAQNTSTDFGKLPNTTLGAPGGSVKVIDNKGTVKYIQTANGLTTFTDAAPDGGVVTTFQLGGTLNTNTYIDATGVEFGIKGLDLLNSNIGYQLVVIDPVTGNLKRLALDDLIVSGRQKFIIPTTTNYPVPAALYTFDLATGIDLPDFNQVYVFRNGAKLLATEDYVVVSGETDQFTIVSTLVELYPGDVIEIHYVK